MEWAVLIQSIEIFPKFMYLPDNLKFIYMLLGKGDVTKAVAEYIHKKQQIWALKEWCACDNFNGFVIYVLTSMDL